MTTPHQEEPSVRPDAPADHPDAPHCCGASACAPAPSLADKHAAGLSPTRQNYLKYIYLEEEAQGYARACKLSETLGVTRSTVALTFRDLKERGYITYERYSPIRLTEKGRAIAAELVRKNKIIKHFFSSVLDLDEKMADKIACELEHVISEAVLGRLARFEGHIALHQSFWRQHEGGVAADAPAGMPAGHPGAHPAAMPPGHPAVEPAEGEGS
ncbi:metal-dependent transcriptional regulator [uncultured Sutterella sp.]|uniref:metal-dependent transcriptional regulator n=1 Tax=uncultured Sutterella sp. TaxID=286133 RepID=UPI0025F64BBF|nr:metal-dependent transcriptional regulator [uncultured Sutterella sp.]